MEEKLKLTSKSEFNLGQKLKSGSDSKPNFKLLLSRAKNASGLALVQPVSPDDKPAKAEPVFQSSFDRTKSITSTRRLSTRRFPNPEADATIAQLLGRKSKRSESKNSQGSYGSDTGRSRTVKANVSPIRPATHFEHEKDSAPPGLKNRNIWGTWRRPMDFTLTLIGYTVGIHDFWRFPYLCYKFGGVFLIPYTLIGFIITIPATFMEFTVGQYYGVGATEAFRCMAPILTGISYLLAWNSVTTSWLYAMMITWSRLYSSDALSCRKGWETCNGEAYYTSTRCYTGRLDEACELAYFKSIAKGHQFTAAEKAEGIHDYLYYNLECMHIKRYCSLVHGPDWKALGGRKLCQQDGTGKLLTVYKARVHACTEYFYGGVAGLKIRNETASDPTNQDKVKWTLNPKSTSQTELRFYSLTTFLVIFIFLTEGFLSVSLITYLMNGVPFVILAYFTVKALSLSHSVAGIEAFLKIGSWDKLKQAEVWIEAIIQNIGTSGVANGVLINLASFNKADYNFTFDLIFSTLLNNTCCLCTTIICFCTIGHYLQYYRINVKFEDFIEVGSVDSSIEFGYVVYTMFLSIIREQKFSIILFFTMITSFSVDSGLRMVQNTMDALISIFPRLRRYRFGVLLGVSLVGVAAVTHFSKDFTSCHNIYEFCVNCAPSLLGSLLKILPMTKNGGFIMFLEYEYYLLNFIWISILLAQTIGINWVYKTFRIMDNAEQYELVSGNAARFYMTVCQQFLSPVILSLALGYNLYFHQAIRFNNDTKVVHYQVLGFTLAFTPFLFLLVSIVEQLALNSRSRWSWLLAPERAHRSDSQRLHIHRHSGLCATNYGPMKMEESVTKMSTSEGQSLGDEHLSPEALAKREKENTLVRPFAMRWRLLPTIQGRKTAETLRAELLPNPALMRLLELETEEEHNKIDLDFELAQQQNVTLKKIVSQVLDNLDHYAAWPGPLESEQERPSTDNSTDHDDP